MTATMRAGPGPRRGDRRRRAAAIRRGPGRRAARRATSWSSRRPTSPRWPAAESWPAASPSAPASRLDLIRWPASRRCAAIWSSARPSRWAASTASPGCARSAARSACPQRRRHRRLVPGARARRRGRGRRQRRARRAVRAAPGRGRPRRRHPQQPVAPAGRRRLADAGPAASPSRTTAALRAARPGPGRRRGPRRPDTALDPAAIDALTRQDPVTTSTYRVIWRSEWTDQPHRECGSPCYARARCCAVCCSGERCSSHRLRPFQLGHELRSDDRDLHLRVPGIRRAPPARTAIRPAWSVSRAPTPRPPCSPTRRPTGPTRSRWPASASRAWARPTASRTSASSARPAACAASCAGCAPTAGDASACSARSTPARCRTCACR